MASSPPRERRTRPANRRELILSAATELFAARGFEHVGMSEIAEAVAVQPSALYRHFPSKEQLLTDILYQGIASLQSAISALDLGRPDGLPGLAGFIIDNRHIAALTGREAPHLPDPPRAGLRSALGKAGQLLTGKILSSRPDLHPEAAGLLAWSTLAVLQSPAFHHAELARDEYCTEVAELARRVISARLPEEFTGQPVPPRPPGLLPYSRREALLARAVTLFAERTYASVRITDVATSLGIAGPSVYNHFRSKTDILVTALSRGSACLSMQLSDTLATAQTPASALSALIASYASFTTEHPAVIDLLISEARSLPGPDREATMTAQRDYVAELVHLLRQVHPELSPALAHVQIQASLMIANDVARIAHLRDQAGSAQAVASLGEQVVAL